MPYTQGIYSFICNIYWYIQFLFKWNEFCWNTFPCESRDLSIFVQHHIWVVILLHISHWWPCVHSGFMFFSFFLYLLWRSTVLWYYYPLPHTSASTGSRDAIQVHLLSAIPVHHATYTSLRSGVMLLCVWSFLCVAPDIKVICCQFDDSLKHLYKDGDLIINLLHARSFWDGSVADKLVECLVDWLVGLLVRWSVDYLLIEEIDRWV